MIPVSFRCCLVFSFFLWVCVCVCACRLYVSYPILWMKMHSGKGREAQSMSVQYKFFYGSALFWSSFHHFISSCVFELVLCLEFYMWRSVSKAETWTIQYQCILTPLNSSVAFPSTWRGEDLIPTLSGCHDGEDSVTSWLLQFLFLKKARSFADEPQYRGALPSKLWG